MQKHWEIFRKKVKYAWLWIWRKDAIIFLLFVGLTSVFWWGRAMSSDREMRMRVPVSYTDIPTCVALDTELPSSIEITLRDEGKQLRQMRRQDLHLHINMSSYLQGDYGRLDLTSDVLRPRLLDILPGSMSLQHIVPEEMSVGYIRQLSKKVAVRLQSRVTLAEQYQQVGDVVLMPDSVEVYGSALDDIDYIVSDSIIIESLRDTVREELTLLVPSGVRLSHSHVVAEWVSDQFTEKGFTLPIQVRGLPAGIRMRLFPQVADVTVRVGVKHFADVDAQDLELYCDYPQDKETDWLHLRVASDNPHIGHIRIQPNAVEYIIER
jgi:hypothetical protein